MTELDFTEAARNRRMKTAIDELVHRFRELIPDAEVHYDGAPQAQNGRPLGLGVSGIGDSDELDDGTMTEPFGWLQVRWELDQKPPNRHVNEDMAEDHDGNRRPVWTAYVNFPLSFTVEPEEWWDVWKQCPNLDMLEAAADLIIEPGWGVGAPMVSRLSPDRAKTYLELREAGTSQGDALKSCEALDE